MTGELFAHVISTGFMSSGILSLHGIQAEFDFGYHKLQQILDGSYRILQFTLLQFLHVHSAILSTSSDPRLFRSPVHLRLNSIEQLHP